MIAPTVDAAASGRCPARAPGRYSQGCDGRRRRRYPAAGPARGLQRKPRNPSGSPAGAVGCPAIHSLWVTGRGYRTNCATVPVPPCGKPRPASPIGFR